MRTTSITRPALAVAVAALLLGGATAALATFASAQPVTETTFYDDANVAVDGLGVNHVVYAAHGTDPGILLRTGSGDTWNAPVRITEGIDYGPSLVLDGSGKHHVVFGRLGDTTQRGVWYATDATGSWVVTRIANDDVTWPSVALDGAGHLQVVYSSHGFTPGVYRLTNASGSWVQDRIVSGHLMGDPTIAISGTGVLDVAVASMAPETRGIYVYAKSGSSAWAGSRVTTTWDAGPVIDVDAAGKVHLAFRRYASGARGTQYATNAGGSWAVQTVVGPLADDVSTSLPAIRLGPAGAVNIAIGWWQDGPSPDNGIYLYTTPGAWSGARVASSGASEDAVPFDLELVGGEVRIAATRWDPAPGAYLATTNVTTPAQPVAASTVDGSPTLGVDGAGHRHVAFHRASGEAGNEDTVQLAGDATGSFELDELDAVDAEPAMLLDGDGKHHVAYRAANGDVVYATDATGSWVATTAASAADTDPSIALDGGGEPWLAYASGGNLVTVHRSGGNWTTEVAGYLSGQTPGRSSIAVDGSGRGYAAIEAGDSIMVAARPLGAWNVYRWISNAFGAVVATNGTTVRLAYGSFDSAPGTYLWRIDPSTMVEDDVRLTRTWSESRPSLAIDDTGHAYVAVARAYWAANPGVFLMTDRSGSAQVLQVTSVAGAWNPSVAVGDGDLVTIAYDTGDAGLAVIAEVDLLSGKVRLSGGAAGVADGTRLAPELDDGWTTGADRGAGTGGLDRATPSNHRSVQASGSSGVAGGAGR